MEPIPPSADKPRGFRPSSLPLLLGVLLALVVLLCLPLVVERIEYSKIRGEVRAINDSLPNVAVKLESLSKAFSLLVKKVGPSVVHIETAQNAESQGDEVESQQYQTVGQASGVIVDADGYIVTNNHVVQDATEISVVLSDNRQFPVEKVETDPASDLAVLKISAKGLIAAEWGDSDQLDVGEMVMAIGNPFGLDHTVTFGIISAKDRRNIGNKPFQDFLQTDAAVNPGNSGGPLINMAGQIIGINTAIVGPTYQGISFALPSNTARIVYEELKTKGKVIRGYLGVGLGVLTAAKGERLGLKNSRGALVMAVAEGSPAARAGIQVDDVIIRWDDTPVDDAPSLPLLVARSAPDTKVKVTLMRAGQKITVEVTLTDRPARLERE